MDPSGSSELRVLRPVHGGLAVAEASVGGGPLVLLVGAIPGELVQARLERRKGVHFGEVERVLEPSPDRVEAPEHPGLDLGHLALPAQLAWKYEVVMDAARRAGVVPPAELPPLRPSPEAWGYRNAVQPVVGGGRPTRLGYRRPGGPQPVWLEEDPTASPALQAAWQAVRSVGLPAGVVEVAMRGNDAGEALLALVSEAPAKVLQEVAHELVAAGVQGVAMAAFDPRGRFRSGTQRLAGARGLRQRYGRFEVGLTATSFAQPNPAAASQLFEELSAWAPPARHALDLYAGSGIIGMHLAATSERVTAAEIDHGAVDRGRADAQRAGLRNIEHIRLDAKQLRLPPDVDLLSVDPPRAGLAAATRRVILQSQVQHLIYVSCDPATWARDVADLQAGGFRLERWQPYDFQPHTHHVEMLSLLSR